MKKIAPLCIGLIFSATGLFAQVENAEAFSQNTSLEEAPATPGELVRVISKKDEKQPVTISMNEKLLVCLNYSNTAYHHHTMSYKMTEASILDKEAEGKIDGYNEGVNYSYYFRFKPVAKGQTKLSFYRYETFTPLKCCGEFTIIVE